MSEAPETKRHVDNDALASYLHSHIIASNAGKRIFDEAAKAWEGTPHGPTFVRLAAEIREDSDELKGIAEGLNLKLPGHKQAISWVGEQAARLDPLNPGHARAGHSGQLELESLISAVTGKSLLWETLLLLADEDVRIDALRMEQLLDRALQQIRDLSEVMRSTAKARFRPEAGKQR